MKLKIQLEEQDYIDAVRSVSIPTRRYIAVTLALLLGASVLAGIFASQGYAREALIGFGVLLARIKTRSHSKSVRSDAMTSSALLNTSRTRGAVSSPSSHARTALDSA